MVDAWTLSWLGSTSVPVVESRGDTGAVLNPDGCIVSSVAYGFANRVLRVSPALTFRLLGSMFPGGIIPSFYIESAVVVLEPSFDVSTRVEYVYGGTSSLFVTYPGHGGEFPVALRPITTSWFLLVGALCCTITAAFDAPIYVESPGAVAYCDVRIELAQGGVFMTFADVHGDFYPLTGCIMLRVAGQGGVEHVIVDNPVHCRVG